MHLCIFASKLVPLSVSWGHCVFPTLRFNHNGYHSTTIPYTVTSPVIVKIEICLNKVKSANNKIKKALTVVIKLTVKLLKISFITSVPVFPSFNATK